MKWLCYISLLALCIVQCRPKPEYGTTQFSGKPEVPASVKKMHEDLLEKIHTIALFQDSTGRAAKKVAELMEHHFKEEEDYVLTPLGILPLLAAGNLPGQSPEIILLTEKLKAQSAHINAEHQLLKALMAGLTEIAATENHPDIAAFEKELHAHAQLEEEVLFPTAILVGEFLKLKATPPK